MDKLRHGRFDKGEPRSHDKSHGGYHEKNRHRGAEKKRRLNRHGVHPISHSQGVTDRCGDTARRHDSTGRPRSPGRNSVSTGGLTADGSLILDSLLSRWYRRPIGPPRSLLPTGTPPTLSDTDAADSPSNPKRRAQEDPTRHRTPGKSHTNPAIFSLRPHELRSRKRGS